MDMWEEVEEDYKVPLLPKNPNMDLIKNHKDRKTKIKGKDLFIFNSIFFNLHSYYVSKVSKSHLGLSQGRIRRG